MKGFYGVRARGSAEAVHQKQQSEADVSEASLHFSSGQIDSSSRA